MTGAQVKRTSVPRTLSLGLTVGRAIREAREQLCDPISALTEALAPTLYAHLRVLFAGKVADVERRTVDGFAKGRARFTSFDGGSTLSTVFQNENLVAEVDGQVRAIVPDLICVLEAEWTWPTRTNGWPCTWPAAVWCSTADGLTYLVPTSSLTSTTDVSAR